MFFGRRKKFQVNNAERTYKVHYLGNVMTSLIKGNYSTFFRLLNKADDFRLDGFDGEQHSKLEMDSFTVGRHRMSVDVREKKREREDEDEEEEDDGEDINEIVTKNNSELKNKINNTIDKPVKILWDNHLKQNGHGGLKMKLTLTQGGLKVNTKDHGVTEYFGHRIHYIQNHPLHPKLFVWVYQHVGKNLKTEIRCHAALCQHARDAKCIADMLNEKVQRTFLEYKREKRRQQNSRLCNTKNGGILLNQLGTRKRSFRSTRNYKPPVQHGMCSAPKLDDVLEEEEEEMEERGDEEEVFYDGQIIYGDREVEIDVDSFVESENESEMEKNLIIEAQKKFDEKSEIYVDEFSSSIAGQQYDNRPITQQMMLSSSSSTSSSTSSSSSSAQPTSTPNDLKALSKTSFDLMNDIAQPQPQPGPAPQQPQKLNESKRCENESIYYENPSCFTEVSYEYLSDLSKLPLDADQQPKLNYSRSFNKSKQQPKPTTTTTTTTFYNPFRRSHISKSFSTFSSRLKQQSKDMFTTRQPIQQQQQPKEEEVSRKLNLIDEQISSLSLASSSMTSSSASSTPTDQMFKRQSPPIYPTHAVVDYENKMAKVESCAMSKRLGIKIYDEHLDFICQKSNHNHHHNGEDATAMGNENNKTARKVIYKQALESMTLLNGSNLSSSSPLSTSSLSDSQSPKLSPISSPATAHI